MFGLFKKREKQPEAVSVEGNVLGRFIKNRDGTLEMWVGDYQMRSVVVMDVNNDCTLKLLNGHEINIHHESVTFVQAVSLTKEQAQILIREDFRAAYVGRD